MTPEQEREAREARETREAKHRRGQCCHEHVVGDTKYYCVEPFGHQCAHSYRPSMHEVERLAKRIADLERELEEARRDAERYRWLREQCKWSGNLTIARDNGFALVGWSGHDPDAAIDAVKTKEQA